jgi:hypothetical protein
VIAGDGNNAAAYFEHAGIVRLHRELEARLDRRWVSARGSLPIPSGWRKLAGVDEIKAQLADIVAKEAAAAHGLWAFKDPRTSRFIPLWTEIFAEVGVTPVYLIAVRHPLSVAASVIKRDALSPARAQLLWLMHTLDALRDTRGAVRRVVEYDRWFTDLEPQARAVVESIGQTWPAQPAELLQRLGKHVRPELRHHQPAAGEYLPHVAETFGLLAEAAQTGQIPPALDEIDARVREAQRLLQGWAEAVETVPAHVVPAPADGPETNGAGGLRSVLRKVAGAVRPRTSGEPGR